MSQGEAHVNRSYDETTSAIEGDIGRGITQWKS